MFEDMIKSIDETLAKLLKPVYPERIYDAMGYSVMAGGKRLRPLLMLLAYKAVGGDENDTRIMKTACALEMIHTYSLIHDDLPAMDNDDLRRGKPTCHKQFDEATAILAGDGLLTYAFQVMLEDETGKYEPKYTRAAFELARLSGMSGMLVGQAVDVESEGRQIDAKTLDFIHKNKTGGLIKAALMAGGIIGGADEKTIKLLEEIGEDVGLAFQIKDDILDVTSTTEVLGKPVFSDEKNQKVTYVSLYGLEKAQSDYAALSESAIKKAEKLGEKAKPLCDYLKSLTDRIK
ncbi:MAG: polyprenyl synthetase family protein [Firmicutes bacterium]|nr:polyprenyl synthetase family protein [Bacillota bacterium]